MYRTTRDRGALGVTGEMLEGKKAYLALATLHFKQPFVAKQCLRRGLI